MKVLLGKSKSGSVKHCNKCSFIGYVINVVVLSFHELQISSSLLIRYCKKKKQHGNKELLIVEIIALQNNVLYENIRSDSVMH